MLKLYVIAADGVRWCVHHDKRAAIDEAMLLARLYPEHKWTVFFTVYESIADAINDNVMVCPECNELMQHCIGVYYDLEF